MGSCERVERHSCTHSKPSNIVIQYRYNRKISVAPTWRACAGAPAFSSMDLLLLLWRESSLFRFPPAADDRDHALRIILVPTPGIPSQTPG